MFALAALVQKFVRMTSDFKKLFTGPGKNYIIPSRHDTTNFYKIAGNNRGVNSLLGDDLGKYLHFPIDI